MNKLLNGLWKRELVLFAPDDPPAGGATPPPAPQPTTPPPAAQQPPAGDSHESEDKWLDSLPEPAQKEIKRLRSEAKTYRLERNHEKQTREDMESRLKKIEDEKKKADESKLAEQGEWQKIAEQREKEKTELAAQLESERLTNLKMKVGLAAGLPEELIGRLQGKTEEELRADAEKLSKVVNPAGETPKPEQQGNPHQAARGQTTTTAVPGGTPVGKTDADRRAARRQPQSPIFGQRDEGVNIVSRRRPTDG